MNGKDRNINRKNEWQRESNLWAETDMPVISGDSILFGRISDYMRTEADIEDVQNDPLFNEINDSALAMISVFNRKELKHKNNARYIRESIADNSEEEKLDEEIRIIGQESREKEIDNVTAGWVREWHEKSQKNTNNSHKSRERKEFIAQSLVKEVNQPGRKTNILLRFFLPAAAVLTGAIFILKSLLTPADPDRLFAKYYEPMSTISNVTRGLSAGEKDDYALAVENYKNQDYQAAATGFYDILQQNPLNISSRFFLGINYMAMGNYEQAAGMLEGVISNQGEYSKEAAWYLGLSLIKTGHPEKASGYFETLTRSTGFYSDRAEKILRRLK